GEALFRMYAGKRTEVIAVEGGGVRHTGVSQQQRKHRGKCRPNDEGGDGAARPVAVDTLHENRDNVITLLTGRPRHLAPGNHTQHADVHHNVNRGDGNDRQDEGPGDCAFGVLHLTTQETHVVIAPVIVGRDEQGSTHAGEERRGKRERAGGKIKGAGGVEVGETGEDDPC